MGIIRLSPEEFDEDVQDKSDLLYEFITKNLADNDEDINLRTLLYAMASLAGFFVTRADLAAHPGLIEEFKQVMTASYQLEALEDVPTDGPAH